MAANDDVDDEAMRLWLADGKAPKGLCPHCGSTVSVVQRGGFRARCSHRRCGASGPIMRTITRAVEAFCRPPGYVERHMGIHPSSLTDVVSVLEYDRDAAIRDLAAERARADRAEAELTEWAGPCTCDEINARHCPRHNETPEQRQAAFDAVCKERDEARAERDERHHDAVLIQEHWTSIPFRVLQAAFNEAELLRVWNSGFFASHLDDYIKRHEFILWKVQNALWHYSYRRSWNNLALIMKGLSKLSVDKPGFELRVSHSTAWNPLGRSYHHSDVFLDGALAFHLFYRGALVLTVAFNPFANGEVGVVQIQLRQKKGNRFLYQLGAHYVDFALDILARAFGEDKLHIVDGKSAVAGVRASYGQSPCAIDEEAEARIAGIYDRPLERFTREEGFSRENLQKRSYFRLIPRTS